jgi:hypothetical protein
VDENATGDSASSALTPSPLRDLFGPIPVGA